MEIVCPLSEEESAANSYEKKQDTAGAEQGVLVPVGGGKDSAVTLELLKGADVPVFAYIINPRGGNHPYHRVCETDSRPCDQCTPYTG